MIPIRLTLKGINSYQAPYEVDFTRLVEGQLFGIFGPVGSGKSTILEAMALALYGETERLNVKDDRNYNLMNLRSDELFIDFVFETGVNADQYRFTIQGKRNRKRFEKVNTFSRAAYHWSEGEWQPIAPDSAEALIGLNYKNFRRTVIIPQGKFQEFLRLKAADRTRMLKEIFSLERFDLGAKVKSLSFKNKQNMERLEGSLAEYATILPENLETKKEILVELQKELNLLETAVERSISQKNIFEEFFQVHERYDRAKQQLEKTKSQLEKIELIVKSQMALFQKMKKQYDGLEALRDKKADLQRLKTINYDKGEILKNKERLQRGAAVLEERKQVASQLETQIVQLQKSLKTMKANRPDFQELSEIRLWYSIKANYQKSLIDVEGSIQQLDKEIKKLSDQALHPLQTYVLSDSALAAATKDLGPAQQFFNRKMEQLSVDISKLEKNERKLLVDTKLGDWAESLEEGEPCPLCGSRHHPDLYNSTQAKKELEVLNKQLSTRKKEFEELQLVLKNFDQLRARLEERQLQRTQLEQKQKDQKEAIEKHLETFIWKTYHPDKAEEVEAAMAAAKAQQEQIEQAEEALEKEQNALKINLEQQGRYKEELLKIEEQQHRLEAEVSILVNNMQILDPAQYEQEREVHLKQNIEDLENQIKDINWNYQENEKRLQEVQKEQNIILGQLKSQKKQMYDIEQEKAIVQGKFNQDKTALPDIIQEWLSSGQEMKAGQQLLSSFIEQIRAKQQTIKMKNEEKATLIAETERLNKDLTKKKKLLADLDKLKVRGANIQLLANLFRGDGFVNYISSIYLQELCKAANTRFFKLTRQQLKLEINAKNEFIIRDYLNEGKTRLAKTLSGGQTFQAALSLALALAESIRQQNKATQNFFFMDEGFGSQDEESLELVLDSLKALRKENRIVGIISHVEALKREIDVFLNIRNDSEKGSQITNSWDE